MTDEWWEKELSTSEQTATEENFRPLGAFTARQLIESGDPHSIGNLVGHLKKEHLRHIGYRILYYADTKVSSTTTAVGRHFYFASRGDYFYRWRNHEEFALPEAIKSYNAQISMAKEAARHFIENPVLEPG